MILYEIHTFREGGWKIDSMFDDKDLAVYEAQRMEKGGRFSAVRVVQETYDEETQKTATRTVYRTTKVDRMNMEVEQKRSKPLAVAPPPKPPKPKKPGISTVTMVITLSAIVLGEIGRAHV